MNDKPTHEFKIHLDDGMEEPESEGKPSKEKKVASVKKHVKKTVGKTSKIVYALVAISIAAMVAGYIDIRSRLLSVHSSGYQETKHLSEDIESKFSALSKKLSDVESSVSKLTESQTEIGSTLSSLNDKLSKADKSISSMAASKADKKGVASSLNEIKKELATVTESVKKNTADTAVMSAKLNATLAEVNSTADKLLEEQNGLKILVEAVQAEKASKKDLLTEIDHVENVLKANQEQSDKQMAGILKSIQRLDIRTSALEAKNGLATPSGSEPIVPDSKAEANKNTTQTQSPALPQPGELIERDISH